MKRVLLSWSSGKDSAWALHILRQQPEVDVVGLLTTFNESNDRAAMQRARRENITHIAFADLFLFLLLLPGGCTTSNCSPAPCITWSLLIGYLTI